MGLRIVRNDESLLHSGSNDLQPYVETFILYTQVKDNTASVYRCILKDFLQNCLQPTQSALVHAYIEEMKKRYSPLTINRRVTIIKQFCAYLDGHDIIPNKVALQTQYNYEYRGGNKDRIPDDKFLEMLDTCDLSTVVGLRDYALLRVIQSTAMRVSEPLGCRVKDITIATHPSGEKVRLLEYTQKNGYKAYTRLFDKTWQAIDAYISFRGEKRPNDWLFQSHSNAQNRNQYHSTNAKMMIRERLNAVGLVGSRYTAHSFRYTQAIKMLELTGDEHKASQQLKHHSPKTIQYYTSDFRGRHIGLNQYDLEV